MQKRIDPRRVRHVSNHMKDLRAQNEELAREVENMEELNRQPSEAARRAADAAYARQLAREQQAALQTGEEAPMVIEKEVAAAHEKVEEKPARKKSARPSCNGDEKKRRIWPWILLGVFVVLLALGIKFYIDINNREKLFANAPITTPVPEETQQAAVSAAPEVPAKPGEPTPVPTPDPEQMLLSQADLAFMKNRVNILVLGVDESTERQNWGSFRTDTMILVTIDFETNDVTMISVPRDSYVKICGSSGKPLKDDAGMYKMNRINSAFSAGGGAQKNGYLYAMNTVSYLLGGIPVHYYVGFNMNVVKQLVDAMGGVDYNVDVEINMNGRHLDTGMQHMNGQAVLDYCRQRKGDSDLHRVDRQQRMLMEIFRQLKSTGQIANIPEIYRAVEQNVQTNLTFTQISSLALLALDMELDQLDRRTVEGTGLQIGSSSMLGVNAAKLRSMIKEVFGISVTVDEEMDGKFIKEQIELGRATIAMELNQAEAAMAAADTILNSYGDWLSSEGKDQLKSLKKQLKDAADDAMGEEDRDTLVYYTATLDQLNRSILAQLGQAGGMQQPVVPDIPPQEPVMGGAEEQIPELNELPG